MLRWLPWVLRVVWVSLPFGAGPLFADALSDNSVPVQRTASIGLWALWAVGLGLTSWPHTVTLTPFRILAPASLAAAVWAAAAGGGSAEAAIGLSVTGLAAVVALSPEIGGWFVNGSAYGDERRIPLRPPGPLLLGPIPLAWALVVAGVVAGPMLLAAKQWIVGALALLVGFAIAWRLSMSLHALAKRWLVFVPAGVVVHDHISVSDPVLFKRGAVTHVGPALVDSGAHDLTMGSLGLVIEIAIDQPMTIAVRAGRSPEPEMVEMTGVLVAASRPGAVVAEAARRRLSVG